VCAALPPQAANTSTTRETHTGGGDARILQLQVWASRGPSKIQLGAGATWGGGYGGQLPRPHSKHMRPTAEGAGTGARALEGRWRGPRAACDAACAAGAARRDSCIVEGEGEGFGRGKEDTGGVTPGTSPRDPNPAGVRETKCERCEKPSAEEALRGPGRGSFPGGLRGSFERAARHGARAPAPPGACAAHRPRAPTEQRPRRRQRHARCDSDTRPPPSGAVWHHHRKDASSAACAALLPNTQSAHGRHSLCGRAVGAGARGGRRRFQMGPGSRARIHCACKTNTPPSPRPAHSPPPWRPVSPTGCPW
jgi:hypothetical protein